MSNDKTPLDHAVDQAMDAFVYAPIGLIFDGPTLFPTLVKHGKNQVQVARVMGEMAVQMGQTELTKRASATSGPVRDLLAGFGLVDQPDGRTTENASPDTATTPPAASNTKRPTKTAATKKVTATKKAKPSKKAARKRSAAAKRAQAKATAAVESLGIPDYDSLSASQVVQRLRGLVPEELDAVKAYESGNRARKTVLNKIAQLQKD